jgi:6-phospho-3-hexuloisomerase
VDIRDALQCIRSEVDGVLADAGLDRVGDLIDAILGAKRVYVTGEGRSGLVARTFAMRLVHLGLNAFVCGDTTTPAIGAEDLCIACSGSGETPITCHRALRSHEAGSPVAALVADPDSTLAREADIQIVLPAPRKTCCGRGSVQFGSSLFEQSLLILLDAVVIVLRDTQNASDESMSAKHANLE